MDEAVADLWDSYLTASWEWEINKDLALARRLAARLTDVSEEVEVVYIDVAVPPSLRGNLTDEEQELRLQDFAGWTDVLADVPAPTDDLVRLGLDVAFPVPHFHSVLFEPGLIEKNSRLFASLNEVGLLDDLDLAIDLMDQANETGYLLSMFAVLEISLPAFQ